MKSTIRIPLAPAEPMPELAEFLGPFRVHFTRSHGRHALDRLLTGLLTDLSNKNCDTVAASIPVTSVQQLQGCCPQRAGTKRTSTASATSKCFNCPAGETAS
jgi:hypothetical protein